VARFQPARDCQRFLSFPDSAFHHREHFEFLHQDQDPIPEARFGGHDRRRDCRSLRTYEPEHRAFGAAII